MSPIPRDAACSVALSAACSLNLPNLEVSMKGIAEATFLRQFAIVGTVSLVFLAGCSVPAKVYLPANNTPVSTPTPTPSPAPATSPSNFAAVGSMSTPRVNHSATLLPNGKVLIAGGSNGSQDLGSAELYDPTTKTFTATGDMATVRGSNTATLLLNGKVLIMGAGSADLYDPSTGTFAATGSMQIAGAGATAGVAPVALLANGKVLYAGVNAELYDPATGTFALAGPYADTLAMSWDTATVLADGRVLLTGASYGGLVAGAELFDPKSGAFSLTGPRNMVELDTATLLTNGTVLVVTASFDVTPDEAAVYDPVSGTFTDIGNTIGYHGYSAAVRLTDGTVLIV